jgi:hypothetical protein
MNAKEAEHYVNDTDVKRHHLITAFLEKKPQNIDCLFDATINSSAFSIKEVADLILLMYEKKICRQIAERKKLKSVF